VHPARGGQYTAIRHAERLDQIGAGRSVGSKGDLCDKPPPSLNSLDKKELIDHRGDWRTVTDVTLSTMEWVAWYNTERLHTFCGNTPDAEYEETFRRDAAGARTVA
jgi:putative transposase